MQNVLIIIFGITGDLAKRKLIPALYHLYAQNLLQQSAIIGVAHQVTSIAEVLQATRAHVEEIDQKKWDAFTQLFSYVACDVTSSSEMKQLAQYLDRWQQGHEPGNRLFYCAISAHLFLPLTQLLSTQAICKKIGPHEPIWHRIVYEKPFGHDLQSAHAINECIVQHIYESQIYRIDHYLTKEMVSNIALVRFTNCFFEPLWNKKYIEAVHIVLHEERGIEGRGAYFDNYGTLRDVVQNHMLQMLALIAMEPPKSLAGEAIRDARAQVLAQIQYVDGILGQYRGYKEELHVNPESTTDTFALLKMQIKNDRWDGVPFFLYAGKKLYESKVAIHIKFKPAKYLLPKDHSVASNWLTFQLSPEGTFLLQINVRKIGNVDSLMPINMEFCHSCAFGSRSSMAYETLLQDILSGQTASVVRCDEIEYSWKVIDAIKKEQLPLYVYKTGTQGPDQVRDYAKKWHMGDLPE